jgi:hypothetical protein
MTEKKKTTIVKLLIILIYSLLVLYFNTGSVEHNKNCIREQKVRQRHTHSHDDDKNGKDDDADNDMIHYNATTHQHEIISSSSSYSILPLHEQATQVGNSKFGCTRQTNHARRHALMRAIIFQKDGQMQLYNLLSHYVQALRYDEIVIINHNGQDDFTLRIIDKYAQLGVHVWNCNGTTEEVMKREALAKGQMWSDVISMYKSDSDFLLPLDVDEHLILRMGAKVGDPFDAGSSYISWNRDDLTMALSKLPKSDKIYKTVVGMFTPIDCGVMEAQIMIEKNMASHCFAKVFFRGTDFIATDGGNHHGYPRGELYRKCERDGVEQTYEMTNFILVHHQVTSFSDWLIHALRKVAEKGVNDRMVNCTQFRRGLLDKCLLWQSFDAVNFSAWELRKLYKKEVCSEFNIEDYDGDRVFINYSNITKKYIL